VLLYTDGTDGVSYEGLPPGRVSLLACVTQYRELPIDQLVSSVTRDLFHQTSRPDDFTMIGFELVGMAGFEDAAHPA
jgi:hypothetical protein